MMALYWITEFVLNVSETRLSGQSAGLSGGRINASKLCQTGTCIQSSKYLPAWFPPFVTRSVPAGGWVCLPGRHVLSSLTLTWVSLVKKNEQSKIFRTNKQEPFTCKKEVFYGMEFRTDQLFRFFFQGQTHFFFFLRLRVPPLFSFFTYVLLFFLLFSNLIVSLSQGYAGNTASNSLENKQTNLSFIVALLISMV